MVYRAAAALIARGKQISPKSGRKSPRLLIARRLGLQALQRFLSPTFNSTRFARPANQRARTVRVKCSQCHIGA